MRKLLPWPRNPGLTMTEADQLLTAATHAERAAADRMRRNDTRANRRLYGGAADNRDARQRQYWAVLDREYGVINDLRPGHAQEVWFTKEGQAAETGLRP